MHTIGRTTRDSNRGFLRVVDEVSRSGLRHERGKAGTNGFSGSSLQLKDHNFLAGVSRMIPLCETYNGCHILAAVRTRMALGTRNTE